MTKWFRHPGALALTAFLFLLSCSQDSNQTSAPSAVQTSPDEAFVQFLDSLFEADLMDSPEWLTSLGRKDRQHELNDISEDHRSLRHEEDLQALAMLKQFNLAKLSQDNQLSFRLKQNELEQRIEDYSWRHYQYWVNQMHGMQSDLPAFMLNKHNIVVEEDAQAYISRLKAIDRKFDQLIDNLQKSLDAGILPPVFVFQHVYTDCSNIIAQGAPLEDNIFLKDFSKKLDAARFEGEQRQMLIDSAKAAISNSVVPAYIGLIDWLKAVEPNATTDDGVWKFPQGKAFYEYRLRKITTTNLSPDQIFELGETEVARIHAEMEAIMKTVGFEGSLQAFFRFMKADQRFYAPNNAAGKQSMLEGYQLIIDNMEARLDELFLTKPKAPMLVKAVEPFREQSAGKAFYSRGTPDGSRPGIFYANLYKTQDMPKYEMEALAYHEGIPGHHMQISIAQELEGVPEFRKHLSYTAYVEGWGLYCELLPKEIGFYQDAYSDFGRLAMELWRACRLVVDVGIHHKQWTRESAIDYLESNTPAPYNQCVKAIERYIVMPGQATAYKIGMLRILDMREAAKGELGELFDLREFHDVLLLSGPVPLSIAEERVSDWVVSKLGQSQPE